LKDAAEHETEPLAVLAARAMYRLIERFWRFEFRAKRLDDVVNERIARLETRSPEERALDTAEDEIDLDELQLIVDLYSRLRMDGYDFEAEGGDRLPDFLATIPRVEGTLAEFDADNDL